MNAKFLSNRSVQIAFSVAILALLVVGVFSYRGIVVTHESDGWVGHTHDVLDELRDLVGAMENAEFERPRFRYHRGYLFC